MRQNNEEYELGTVEVIVNKVEKTLTKVIFSDYLGTIEYTPVSYTHLRAHETLANLEFRLKS